MRNRSTGQQQCCCCCTRILLSSLLIRDCVGALGIKKTIPFCLALQALVQGSLRSPGQIPVRLMKSRRLLHTSVSVFVKPFVNSFQLMLKGAYLQIDCTHQSKLLFKYVTKSLYVFYVKEVSYVCSRLKSVCGSHVRKEGNTCRCLVQSVHLLQASIHAHSTSHFNKACDCEAYRE